MDRAARDYIFENGLWLYHEDVTPTEYGYWVEAKDLKVGDVFLGANGELSTLTNIVRVELDDEISVFNFSVEGNHNYFVLAKENDYGQTCILVHNSWNYGLIDPTNIRYSQDSIKRSISGPSGTIDKLRDGLKNGTINPKDLPPIKIDKNGFTGEIYSLDNRRLWAAKEAGTKVNAQWATNADVHNALKQGKSPAGLTVNIIDK